MSVIAENEPAVKKSSIVLYHRGCNDGIAAAWAAHNYIGEEADYIPYQYGEKLPDFTDKWVYAVDMSIPKHILDVVSKTAKGIMIIDHHVTALQELEFEATCNSFTSFHSDLNDNPGCKVYVFGNVDYSGAVLSWLFFSNSLEKYKMTTAMLTMPRVLKHIQDYDLWKFNLPNTREINSWLANGPRTIERFGSMIGEGDSIKEEVITIGKMFVEYDDGIIKSVCKAYPQYVTFNDGKQTHHVPCLNTPHHLRDFIGDYMLKTTKAPFIVLYTERDGATIVSMRSNGYDVAAIAKRFGSGGHHKAAAFRMKNDGPDLKLISMVRKPTVLERLKAIWNIVKGDFHRL